LLLASRHPEDRPLASVTPRRGAAPPAARTLPVRRRAATPRRHSGAPAIRLGRALARAPLALRLAAVVAAVLIVLAIVNVVYQVARKPTELFGLVVAPAPLTPSETWTRYGPQFRAHATDLVRAERLRMSAPTPLSCCVPSCSPRSPTPRARAIPLPARRGGGAGRGTRSPCTRRPPARWGSTRSPTRPSRRGGSCASTTTASLTPARGTTSTPAGFRCSTCGRCP